MNKKLLIIMILFISLFMFACKKDNNKKDNGKTDDIVVDFGDLLGEEYLYAKVKDEVLKLRLEDNKAAKNLYQEIKKADLELNADDFEEFAKYVKLNSIDDKDIKEIDVKVGDVVIDKDNNLYIFFKNYTGSYQKVASISNANSENLQSTLGYEEDNIKIKLSVNNK